MNPTRLTALTVTPLEDRRLAAVLTAPQLIAPAPTLVTVPAQMVPPSVPSPWTVQVGPGAVASPGGWYNHNETFVRRRRKVRR